MLNWILNWTEPVPIDWHSVFAIALWNLNLVIKKIRPFIDSRFWSHLGHYWNMTQIWLKVKTFSSQKKSPVSWIHSGMIGHLQWSHNGNSGNKSFTQLVFYVAMCTTVTSQSCTAIQNSIIHHSETDIISGGSGTSVGVETWCRSKAPSQDWEPLQSSRWGVQGRPRTTAWARPCYLALI